MATLNVKDETHQRALTAHLKYQSDNAKKISMDEFVNILLTNYESSTNVKESQQPEQVLVE